MSDTKEKQVINDELKARLKDENIWVHLVHLIMYGFAFCISSWIFFAITVLHFILRLITGEPNKELQRFGQSLSTFIYSIVQFASFNTDEKPFPLSAWPSGPPKASPETSATTTKNTANEEE